MPVRLIPGAVQLNFHDEAALQIFSEGSDTGTEVLITIPAKDRQEV